MNEPLAILFEISLPIIALIAVGFGFQKIFKTDIRTYSKLAVYLLVPVVIFTKMYEMDFTWDLFALVVPFVIMLEVAMFIISLMMAAALRFNKSMRNAFSNAMVLFNTGNYGIPLISLVFKGNPLAMASQIFIVLVQNITVNTFGVYQASAGHTTARQAFSQIIKMPALYALVLVAVVKITGITLPTVLTVPLGYISDFFIGFALITLGVQLAEVKIGSRFKETMIASVAKVFIAPTLGFGLVLLLGVKGLLAQALVIGIATPTAVNTAIYAREFGNEPDFAAQIVLATTVFCTFTLPLVIWIARSYF